MIDIFPPDDKIPVFFERVTAGSFLGKIRLGGKFQAEPSRLAREDRDRATDADRFPRSPIVPGRVRHPFHLKIPRESVFRHEAESGRVRPDRFRPIAEADKPPRTARVESPRVREFDIHAFPPVSRVSDRILDRRGAIDIPIGFEVRRHLHGIQKLSRG